MTDIVPRARRELVPRIERTQHRRPTDSCYPQWRGYSSQRHICDLVIDPERDCLWIATWGGVLCWESEIATVTRYTSEHGLVGNPTQALALDRQGTLWAIGHNGSVSALLPNTLLWQPQQTLTPWKVRTLTARPAGGVFVALDDGADRYALGEIAEVGAPLCLLAQGGIPCRAVDRLIVDQNDAVWTGNLWGAHCYEQTGEVHSVSLDGARVSAFALDMEGHLHIGTNRGVFSLRDDRSALLLDAGPHDEVLDLIIDTVDGSLWVSTPHQVGWVRDTQWEVIVENTGEAVIMPGLLRSLAVTYRNDKRQVWGGGANGLYEVNVQDCKPAFDPDTEDLVSNGVQCLLASRTKVWLGTARGLACYSGERWHSYDRDVPTVQDIRAIIADLAGERLYIGAWRGGLGEIVEDVYLPTGRIRAPIVALTQGLRGSLWAATPDALYYQEIDGEGWISAPSAPMIGGGLIQTLCFQETPQPIIWVGTSNGLFCYLPELELWNSGPDALARDSIQALCLDPTTQHLWVGTSQGLFSEPLWHCDRYANIQAIVFGTIPEGTLWLGTTTGIEQWPAPTTEKIFTRDPLVRFTVLNSALGADTITALAIRSGESGEELWIGTPSGTSCYYIQC